MEHQLWRGLLLQLVMQSFDCHLDLLLESSSVCGRFSQLLTEIPPGCLAVPPIPGSAETMGIGHAHPCPVQATLHCHYLKNKFLIALRKNFIGKRANRKDYSIIHQCL